MSDLLVNGGHIDGVTRWHVSSSSKVSDIGSILNQLSTSISCGHGHRGVTLSLITRFVLQATASWQKIYAVYGSDWSTVIARV